MFTKLKSLFLRIYINAERLLDHTYREITGLPTLKRSLITSQIYLGGQYGPKTTKKMKQLGITAIVNMRTTPILHIFRENFHTLHLPTPDFNPPSIEQLQEGVNFMEKEITANGKVYVHCHWGEGRGPSMVIAYLMKTGLTFDDAVNLVRKVRQFIALTPPQIMRLKEFEKIIKIS